MKKIFIKILNNSLDFLFGISLLRFNQHSNGIIVINNKKKNIFTKISFSINGSALIKNEIRGYTWYLNNIKKKNFLFFKQNIIFSKLSTKSFFGIKAPWRKNIIKNSKYYILSLKHYEKIWKNKNILPAHGDLTYDNLIFDKKNKNTFIIDWENYKEKGEVWGFDISYLLLSSLILPNIKKRSIHKNEKKKFIELWRVTKRKIKSRELRKNPFLFFEKKFKRDVYWNKLSKKYPGKYFLLRINSSLRNEVISLF